ncbi:MAG TPA: O-antigen ligase family protein [Candidatus Binatia bacterium]|jgi:O-antigen ligase
MARVVLAAAVLAIAATGLAVDPRAEAAFDAPKRLAAVVAVVAATLALLWSGRWRRADRAALGGRAGLLAALLAAGLATSAVAALGAAHRAVALDTTRVAWLLACVLPLGASRALDGRGGRVVLAVFLGVAAVNALLAVTQALGLISLFAVESIAGRIDAGALLGNEGQLAQVLALAVVAAATIGIAAGTARTRGAAGALLLLYGAGIVATRNLTALATAAAGVASALVLLRRGRAVLPLGVLALALAASVVALPPLRARVLEAGRDLAAGNWDAVLTYRLGPWTAGLEMVRERPLAGFGVGTFGAEFMTHRLAAELRFGRRFTVPLLTSTFAQAHCDYLQLAAEAGVPAALAALAAAALLLGGLMQLAWRTGDAEAVLLGAVLTTAALMALAWFPLQIPPTALPILLATGRGWRRLRAAEPRAAVPIDRRVRLGAQVLATLVLLGAAAPEVARYRAERQLRGLTSLAQALFAQPGHVRDARRILTSLNAAALALAPALPGDARAPILAGSSLLVAGDADGALERYGRALALGERPEIVLNEGRALALRGDAAAAQAAFVRAVWASPMLLDAIPETERAEVGAAIDETARALLAGRLVRPPALPAASGS